MRRPGVLVLLLLAVGIAGTVLALRAREGDPVFVAQQQALTPVAASSLQRLMLTTSDPRPGFAGRAQRASCDSRTSGAHNALGNPWTCLIRYPRPPSVRYRVTVYPDRSIRGLGQAVREPVRGALIVKGCCVAPAP